MARLGVWILICATLGAATSFGVAWTLAVAMPKGSSAPYQVKTSFDCEGVSYQLIDYGAGHSRLTAYDLANLCMRGRDGEIDELPAWAGERIHSRMMAEFQQGHSRNGFVRMYGYPFECLWGARWLGSVGRGGTWGQSQPLPEELDGLVLVPSSLIPAQKFLADRGWDFRLPVRIIPTGAAANSAIYGAAWIFLLAAPHRVQRWKRSRRVHCGKCGYDLSGVSAPCCPECGKVFTTSIEDSR